MSLRSSGSVHSSVSRSSHQRLVAGEAARPEHFARVSRSRIDGGPADGTRVVDITMQEGFSARILLDRGMDLGAVWAFGVPIGWSSKVGEIAPLERSNGMAWIERFTGGLLTTCGPDNIGIPNTDTGESLGLHGSWSFLRADDVVVERFVDGGELGVRVRGALRQTHALLREIDIVRTLTFVTGRARLDIEDVITNSGTTDEPLPMLYHVNVGTPLWSPGAHLVYPEETTRMPRNSYAEANLARAGVAPKPERNGEEYVFEQRLPSGLAEVRVVNPDVGLRLSMQWSRDSLPTFHQWIHPAERVYALGIEPANTLLGGRAADRDAGAVPTLLAGEARTFSVTIEVDRI